MVEPPPPPPQPHQPHHSLAPPCEQQWAEVLGPPGAIDAASDCHLDPGRFLLGAACRRGRGQALQLCAEVEQDTADPAVFRVDGKDKSWFMQKGGIVFECPTASSSAPADGAGVGSSGTGAGGEEQAGGAQSSGFRLEFQFVGDDRSRFGDEYADLSRAEQHATINWLLMVGACRSGYQLTGYKDCKCSGYYFLLHLNYRRTRWRVICCPHDAEMEDMDGKLYTCDPQDAGHFELPAAEGQRLGVELAHGVLWLTDGGQRVARGRWRQGSGDTGGGAEEGVGGGGEAPAAAQLPGAGGGGAPFWPAVLTPNCPTALRAVRIA